MQHDDTIPQQEDTFDLARSDELPAKVVFGEAESPLFEIAVYTPPTDVYRRRIDLDPEQRAAISGVLSQAPALIQSGYLALNATFRLSFAPGVADKMTKIMQAQGGGLRASALNPQGKIIGNGVLTPTNGMQAIAATTAVWQTLSIITAQVHLAEINARLGKIERGVDDIRALVEADQASQIEMGLRYMRETSAALERRDMDEAEQKRRIHWLEGFWLECGRVARTMIAMLSHARAELTALPLSAWYQLEGSALEARKALDSYERRAHVYLTAEYVRCATVALGSRLGLSSGIQQARLDELQADLADWRAYLKTFFVAFNQRVNQDLSATFNKQTTIDAQRFSLLAEARKSEQRLLAFCEELEQMVAQVRARTQAAQPETTEAVTLIVTLDERGQIAEVFHVPNLAQEPVLNSTRGQRDD